DEQKITKYHLSDKQLELLNSFSGENKLEGILSRYSGGHRESLLKIIYFFLMTELLIKKEFDLSDSSVFEEENAFDFFQSDTSATDSKPAQPAAEPPKEQPGQTGQNYVFGDNDKHVDTAGLQTPQPAQSAPVKADATAVPPPGFIREAGIGDKKTKKIKVFNLILVVMILVVGGIILLILPVMLNEDPIAKVIKNPDTVELKDNGDIITIEEQKPAVQTEDNSDGTPGKNGDKETGKPGTETLEKTAIQKPGLKPTVKEPAQKKTEPKKKEELKKKEVKPVLKPGKSAMAYFGEGSMITAADIWKRELKREKIKFSVLLELDCLKESVVNAYSRMTVKSGFFILPRASRGRTCFLVMWGKFHSKADAAKGLKSIPQYFWQQQNPPEVVDVTKYL
ncbi:MAG: hypothetical protein GY950_13575, partial [bacterium]|nr:hypothetical protein [bacterium]